MKTIPIILLAAGAFVWGCSNEGQKTEDTSMLQETDSTRVAARGDSTALAEASVAESKTSFAQVQVGMKDEKVRALIGKPSEVEVINPEVGARVEDWWYGKNQKVRMTGGQVTRITRDVAKEQETLLKINEAKAKG